MRLAIVSLVSLVDLLENGCLSAPHDGMRRRRWGEITDGVRSSAAAEWPDPEGAVALRSQSDGSACAYVAGWL